MKILNSIAIAGLICIVGNGFAQQTKLTADIKGLADGEVSMNYYKGAEWKTVKMKTNGGKFSWTGSVSEPQKAMLNFSNQAAWFYLEPGSISIKGTADSLYALKVKGSKTQAEADAFEATLKPMDDQMDLLYQQYRKVKKEEQPVLEQKIADTRNQIREVQDKYIAAHPESIVSLTMVTDRGGMGDYPEVNAIYQTLGPKAKASSEGKRVAERLALLKRSEIGSPMLNFTQNDVDGKSVSFSSFRGKYVLVDFWASWCGPCRAENPNVLREYNKYKDKNFTVVGISLDDKPDSWKKAIKDDGMPWTQLSDSKGWKNEVSTYYGIQGIPMTFLIDPQGNIIAKGLRGAMLSGKLEELFKN